MAGTVTFVTGAAEIGLAGAISLMGVAMSSPISLENMAPIPPSTI